MIAYKLPLSTAQLTLGNQSIISSAERAVDRGEVSKAKEFYEQIPYTDVDFP